MGTQRKARELLLEFGIINEIQSSTIFQPFLD